MIRTMPKSSVIAVDLGGTKIAAASVDARGSLGKRIVEPVDHSSPSAPVDQIVRIARQFAVASAIGVAVPGLVQRDETVWAPNLPGWDRMPLARMLRRKLKIPVFVEADRNAVVLGESWRGVARGKDHVIVLILGTGIGAGILSEGRIIRGAHELSGCAGWMVVTEEQNEETRRCGALEALAAGPAIGRAGGSTAEALAAAARKGDANARRIFARAAQRLGLAVANLINLFDPEIIVLTGGLTGAADVFLEDLKRAARQFAHPLSAPKIEIAVSVLGVDANLLGVARLALKGEQ